MKNDALVNDVATMPMSELASYHQQMVEKYKNISPDEAMLTSDGQKLMTFNGYYALNPAANVKAGAFFAIDTNMHIKNGSSTPIYDLALLISLNGTTSIRVPFTGTFDGTHLVQQSQALLGVDIDLTFTHTDGSDGTTATCQGTISLPHQTSVQVSGATYNNPIPSSLYIGDYYETINGSNIKVMSIGNNYQLQYDNGTNSGNLQSVPTYAYNLNMYYFSFKQGTKTVSLIMGTAGAQGYACNNMVLDTSVTPNTTTTRSLLTIPDATVAPFKWYDISDIQLANFSGYYPLPSIAPGAFLSVQAEYATISEALNWDLYSVMISVSLDGKTSNGYYFDPTSMKFEGNTLTMPNQSITLTFNRTYDTTNGSLVTVTGTISGNTITAYTLLNPVPLTAFGAIPLTNADGTGKLTITNNNEVTYNGTLMDSIIYVPLMYILAYPIKDTKVVMSLGTDGLKGTACIITDSRSGTPVVSFVYGIPNAQ